MCVQGQPVLEQDDVGVASMAAANQSAAHKLGFFTTKLTNYLAAVLYKSIILPFPHFSTAHFVTTTNPSVFYWDLTIEAYTK